MSDSAWWDLAADPRVTWVRVCVSDPSGRWYTGEVGILLTNTYPEKYDALVLFPPRYNRPWTAEQQAIVDSMPPDWFTFINTDRAFYFYASDLRYERGPGLIFQRKGKSSADS